jgi:hypothetical protein
VLWKDGRLSTAVCKHGQSSAYASEMGLLEFDPLPRRDTLDLARALLAALPDSVQTPVTRALLSRIEGALADASPFGGTQ